jgi:divalent metal cation (Fe/Co/Zn/Cd) transporter
MKESKDRKLLKKGLKNEYVTLSWNVMGVLVTAYAAIIAHSIAIGGFGLDSMIEIGASTIVIRELTNHGKHHHSKSLRLIGFGFFAIAAYILIQTIYILYKGVHPHSSTIGITWTALTFLVMLALALGKRIVGTKLNNTVLLTEGKVTLVDAYLAASVMTGLILNAAFGWWWADPLAGLVIVFYGLKEGCGAFREARAERHEENRKN